MAQFRLERIGALIQNIVGELIVSDKIKDPRVDSFLSITSVKVSKDLTYADCSVSSFKSEAGVARGVAGLNSAAGFIQSQLASRMRLRVTPHLRFHVDEGIRDGFEVIQKIDEVIKEDSLIDEKP
ncbi:MAG: 30S ribosome-binding factor RbfA [Spirochaetaceae bacterium]|jgi:ribosome-binding factor A|nr:30S ribosome-binding factor RbfA [Spirochaetaceae bacterium]